MLLGVHILKKVHLRDSDLTRTKCARRYAKNQDGSNGSQDKIQPRKIAGRTGWSRRVYLDFDVLNLLRYIRNETVN